MTKDTGKLIHSLNNYYIKTNHTSRGAIITGHTPRGDLPGLGVVHLWVCGIQYMNMKLKRTNNMMCCDTERNYW